MMLRLLSGCGSTFGHLAACGLIGIFACLVAISPSVVAAARPNILFIYTDDQSYRTVSCYPGAPDWVQTPNIDRLAAEGVRFESAYIGTWCMPSRATLLTGRHSTGIESMRMEGTYPGSEYDPQRCAFWPRTFRDAGYVTGQIGKWHTGTDTGFGRDWDFQKVWNRPRHTGNAGKYYDNQLIESNGGPAELVTGYSTDNYTDWAIDFIRGEQRDAAQPWYLWLCYGAVHGPYEPAERHRALLPNVRVPIPTDIYPPRAGKPAYVYSRNEWILDPDGSGQPVHERARGLYGRSLHDWERQYNQGVLAIDEGVGRLLEALEQTGQRENTLVVFTSDQGFAWGQHGFRHKLAPYDSNLRAPLIISRPGSIPKEAVCATPVGGIDLVPTFFAQAGIELPWDMPGHDLSPLLEDPSAEWPHPLLTLMTGDRYGSDTAVIPADDEEVVRNSVPWWVSLRQQQYKYIRTLVKDEIEELYDLEQDPEELNNLALDPDHRKQLLNFREATVSELRRVGAKLVDNLPEVGTFKASAE
ncbi:MAG: sulfatase-like hydrolase/transferase [Planctomycetaceae bacterium]|nr:sulfatase-like hydrolase/transferase [Planctomycetaceae bacterium]